MSEYPEDVMKAAEAVYRNEAVCPVENIAAAIMAERQRCAGLVQRIRFMDEFDRDALLSEINQPGVKHMHETQWLTSLPSSAAPS